MTSTDPPTLGVNEPDGVTEMFARREQRKARYRGRKPRTVPQPHHPRPPTQDDPAVSSSTADPSRTEPTRASANEAEEVPSPLRTALSPFDTSADGSEPFEVPAKTVATATERDEESGEPSESGADDQELKYEPERSAPETAPGAEGTAEWSSEPDRFVSVPPSAAGTAKVASDAALSWAAAARKQARRLNVLADAVRRARAQGVPQLVLSAAIAEAEHRAGVSLPPEIWSATTAGTDTGAR